MRRKEILKVSRLYCFVLSVVILIFMTGCCASKYSYFTYRKKGEAALMAKDYKKAQNYYSIIYKNESKSEKINTERTNWAFYRLGVIAELMGDVKRARGYYWGDAIDEGFYANERLIGWYAQGGWTRMDETDTPRTLDEILEFEKTEPPEVEEAPVERKKEIIVQTRKRAVINRPNTDGVITKTYNGSVTPPAPGTPEPFRVSY